VATTSAGIAWASGLPDGGALDLDTMLGHVERLVAAVGVPVTADLESGYGDPATAVRRAVEVGAVGGNLEDQVGGVLLGVDEAAERIAAARSAAPAGTFVLNARTDTWFGGLGSVVGGDPFEETVERARRYVEAGADCVFVPAVDDEETIRRLADAVPAPLNTVAGLSNTIPAPRLFELGVRRVSVGGSIARAAYTAAERAGRELLEHGTLRFLDGAAGYADLQRRFGG
jgi:2-methylisocitrate lyase-like PEP mutase family enzyme